MNRQVFTDIVHSFRGKEFHRALVAGLWHRAPEVIMKVVAAAVIRARTMKLPEPEPGSMASHIADLGAASGAEVLLGLLRDEKIWFEDHCREIVKAFGFIELERRAVRDPADPEGEVKHRRR